jgi:hypothetical protein
MAAIQDLETIKKELERYYNIIREYYPVERWFIYI